MWEEVEISALKYDLKYPFIVVSESSILYSSKEDGGRYFDIWKMNLDGTGHLQLTDNDIDELMPTSDKGGEKIVFSAYRDTYYEEIHEIVVMDFDGTDQRNITDDDFRQIHPSLSRDGNWIVFSSDMDNTSADLDIWKCDTDGTSFDQITDHAWDEYLPSLSPDGGRVVFVAEETDGDEDIHTIGVDGNNWNRLLTRTGVDEDFPTFASDGKIILYTRNSKAAIADAETGETEILKAETVNEDGDIKTRYVEGFHIRFYQNRDNVHGNDIKLILSSQSGTTYPDLSIWSVEYKEIYYTVNIGPVERETGNYDEEPVQGATVSFEYDGKLYRNLTGAAGLASFWLPVGQLPDGIPINATKGNERVTWKAGDYPESFTDDIIQIGPIRRYASGRYSYEPVEGVEVNFTYGGETYRNKTDEGGYVEFLILDNGIRLDSLPSDTEIRAVKGDEYLSWVYGSSPPHFTDHRIKIGPIRKEEYSDDYFGVEVEGARVSFTYGGKKYSNTTDHEGSAYFIVIDEGERLEELPEDTEIKATYDGDTIKWRNGVSEIPQFRYRTSILEKVEDYLAVCIVGVVIFIIVLANVIAGIIRARKRSSEGTRKQRGIPPTSPRDLFDRGRSSAKEGNELYDRKQYSQALERYSEARDQLERAADLARRSGDDPLVENIEGMINGIRDNAVSAEMAKDKLEVDRGYSSAKEEFQRAQTYLGREKIFEARSLLMETSRTVEYLISIAKSRNFVQAIKNLTAFQIKVREKINQADIALSQGIERVSSAGQPDIDAGGVMAEDIRLTAGQGHQGGYLVVELSIENDTMFGLDNAELKLNLEPNVLQLSHTKPHLPATDASVSVGNIAKNSRKRIELYFDPLVCTDTHIGGSLIYRDQADDYRTAGLKRMEISIRPPEFISLDNVNIATLQEIIVSKAVYQDSKVYNIAPNLPLKEVLSLAKEGVDRTDLSKVRETRSGDMDSVWFYGSDSSGGEKVIVRVSVLKSTRALEIFAACSQREPLLTVLADMSEKVLDRLNRRWQQLRPVTRVNVEIKDSIIQRSNLGLGGMVDGGGGVGGGVNITDSVLTRSSVAGGDDNTGLYRNLLIFALQDGNIDKSEEDFLARKRKELGISKEVHYSLLTGLNR